MHIDFCTNGDPNTNVYFVIVPAGEDVKVTANFLDTENLNLEKDFYQQIDCESIDIVPTRRRNCMLVVDGDGIAKNKPLNPLASVLYGSEIYGTAVLCCRAWLSTQEPDVYAFPFVSFYVPAFYFFSIIRCGFKGSALIV